jgi:hypothetical protein
LQSIKEITQEFFKYMNKFSLEISDHEHALQSISSNKFLPNRSIVLPGAQIFNIFLDGTRINDIGKDGKPIEKDLRSEWHELDTAFNNALLDIAEISQD